MMFCVAHIISQQSGCSCRHASYFAIICMHLVTRRRLHLLNKKPATARLEVKELQDCFAKREKTALMRTVEASRYEIQLRSMKGPREVGISKEACCQ